MFDSRIHVVDDDRFFLDFITRFLERSGFLVTPHVSVAGLLANLKPADTGCVLADLQMPGMNGLMLLDALNEHPNPLPVVFLTGAGTIPDSVKAMKQGAEDFLTKDAPKSKIIAAIKRALERDEQQRSQRQRRADIRSKMEMLTDREREVLAEVVKGRLNKQIADQLDIHERTVKLHRTSITTKLALRSVAELTKFWMEGEFESMHPMAETKP
ncbi:MAG: hypothetical protein RL346_1490 [Verrucomicrobiota bacterium]|jgi:two-component system response regulator FixJ